MKKEYDRNGRTTYKFSHSACQGGNLYCHGTKEGTITDKNGLKNALEEIVRKFGLIDATIKVYDNIFFLFFLLNKSLAPQTLIDEIQKSIEEANSLN